MDCVIFVLFFFSFLIFRRRYVTFLDRGKMRGGSSGNEMMFDATGGAFDTD